MLTQSSILAHFFDCGKQLLFIIQGNPVENLMVLQLPFRTFVVRLGVVLLVEATIMWRYRLSKLNPESHLVRGTIHELVDSRLLRYRLLGE